MDQPNSSEDRRTRARRSYIGIGGAVGLSGEQTGLSRGGFATVGRIGLADNLSIHTASVIGNRSIVTAALTAGLPIRSKNNRVAAYPFVGGGVGVNTSNDFRVDPLLTAGVDVPVAERLTATGRVSVAFNEDEADLGMIIGAGFSF